jgi:hypothetical protein
MGGSLMDFYEVLDQVVALLQTRRRVTYAALKLQFKMDDEHLQVLKAELIEAQRIAADEEGKILVWIGDGAAPVSGSTFPVSSSQLAVSRPPPPRDYTPLHLAERIRSEQAAMEARGVSDGERKTITALFADLKGSTALIEGLDPEEARAIIQSNLAQMNPQIQRRRTFEALKRLFFRESLKQPGIFHSYFLALLAEAYGKAGQAEERLAALAEALTVVDKSGERFYEAELYRLKGELTLAQSSI